MKKKKSIAFSNSFVFVFLLYFFSAVWSITDPNENEIKFVFNEVLVHRYGRIGHSVTGVAEHVH